MIDPADAKMTKGERDELLRLIRARERVGKSAAGDRAAQMMAEFERQVSAIYAFNTDETWAAIYSEGARLFQELNERVTARSEELGIPKEFQPRLQIGWAARGESMFQARVAELRRVAKSEAEAAEKKARTEIEIASVNAQTEIMRQGITTTAAAVFLDSLPAVEKLMPALDVRRIEHKVDERNQQRRQGRYDA